MCQTFLKNELLFVLLKKSNITYLISWKYIVSTASHWGSNWDARVKIV